MKYFDKLICFASIFVLTMLLHGQAIYAEQQLVEDCFNQEADCEAIDEVFDANKETPDQDQKDQAPLDQQNSTLLEGGENTPSLISSFFRMIFALLLILGLIFLMVRFLNRRNSLFQQSRTLENLGGISVGQNKSIQVVRVGKTYYLIGVGDNVELLREIDDQDLIESLTHQSVEEALSFKQWFKSSFPLGKSETKQVENQPFNHLLIDEISKMKQKRQAMIDRAGKRKDIDE